MLQGAGGAAHFAECYVSVFSLSNSNYFKRVLQLHSLLVSK